MSDPAQLLVDHLDIWTGAIERKSGSGRGRKKNGGNGGKISLYGIDKLRSLILDLAVRGKLVPQAPADGDALELLRAYESSKQELLKAKSIRKQKVSTITSADEVPFETPDGWAWARLGEIGFVCNGNSISSANKKQKYSQVADHPFIATKDVGYGFDPLDYEGGVWIPAEEPKFVVASAGTTLICSEGGSAGKKCGLTEQNVCFGNKLFAVNHYGAFEPKFLLAWYQTTTFYELFSEQMTGIIGGISLARFIELPCPVPSISEQKRIVAKVDELMTLVDALEAGTRAGIAAHETLVRELLATLVNSQDTDDLAQNWSRIEAHFDTLFTTEESIDALNQAIFDVAVTGSLSPRFHSKVGATGKNSGASYSCDEVPWVTIADLNPEFQNGASSRGMNTGDEITVLRLADITHNQVDLSDVRRLRMDNKTIDKYALKRDDFLIIRVNGSAELVGRFIHCKENLDAIYCDHFIRLRNLRAPIEPRFLAVVANTNIFRKQIESLFVSTAGQKTVNQKHIGSVRFPLPPMHQQQEILELLSTFSALCERLKRQVVAGGAKALILADALTAESSG